MKTPTLLQATTGVVEVAVIGTCAFGAFNIATAQGAPWWMATPLLSIAAIEALRVPTAIRLPKLKWYGMATSLLLLATITPLTFEAASCSRRSID